MRLPFSAPAQTRRATISAALSLSLLASGHTVVAPHAFAETTAAVSIDSRTTADEAPAAAQSTQPAQSAQSAHNPDTTATPVEAVVSSFLALGSSAAAIVSAFGLAFVVFLFLGGAALRGLFSSLAYNALADNEIIPRIPNSEIPWFIH
ncbi:MAG: hypothetical protein Q3972_02125 [Corynebacterium sp.]|nr:hypothetical protein [Corynebacterium sp.]